MVQSFVALGRDRQCIISIYGIWRSHVICSCLWRSHRRISCMGLLKQRSLGDCNLYRRFLRLLALPNFCDGPKQLSRRFAKYFYHVVLCNFLRGMFEENEMVLIARDYGPLGQSAWRLFAWFSYYRHFLRRGFAETRLGKLQNLQFCRGWLLRCDVHQPAWLAYLRRLDGHTRPLCARAHHRMVFLLSEFGAAGEYSRHDIYPDIHRA